MEDSEPTPAGPPPAPSFEPPGETAASGGREVLELLDRLEGVILGQREMLEQMAITLLAGGHALLEGVPGTAKTLAIQALAECVDAKFSRIQFTPDLMPTDITGLGVFDERIRDFEFRAGPIFADFLLADEINRAPAKTQSALLEAMQERQVTVDGTSHDLPELFTVFASQNPVEYEGTYPLPEAQLDRFLMKITIPYPSEVDEVRILDRTADGFDASDRATFGLTRTLSAAALVDLRRQTRDVRVETEVRRYITALVRQTREDPALALGASPRATVGLFRAAQGKARLEGRDFVIPDDVKEMARPVLRHRVALTAEAEVDGASADLRVDAALRSVPAPQ